MLAAGGLAAFGLALGDRVDLANLGDDYRNRHFRAGLGRAFVHVSVGPALDVVMVGGVIVTIGTMLASSDR